MLVIKMTTMMPQTVRHSLGERVSWMCLLPLPPALRVEEVVQCVLQWSSMESLSLTERVPFKLMQHKLTQQSKLVNYLHYLESLQLPGGGGWALVLCSPQLLHLQKQ